MFRTRDEFNRDARFSSVPEAGTDAGNTGQYYLDPVLDDGRRVLTTTTAGVSLTGNRYIVGVGATGAWVNLVGELVTYTAGAWLRTANVPVGALAYSQKRDEYLTLIQTLGPTITPSLTPEVLEYDPDPLLFWMPNSLVDSFYSNWKGRVSSVTTNSSSWLTTMYNRYVVPVGDPTYGAFSKFIATYVADITTHSGKWVFQPASEGDLLYSTGDNNFYYFDGTSWVVMSSGNTAFYGAEGRPGVDGLGNSVITADTVNTYKKIAFDLSAITNLTYCPPSFFADGGDTFTVPRYGIYAVGYHGFRVTYGGLEPDSITICVKVNGVVVENSTLPVIDDYEGDSYHGIFELNLNDEVTFEFKTTGTHFDTALTIHNGFSAYVYTVDAKGGTGPVGPHALNYHTDTNFPSPSNGDVIKWDAGTGKWVSGSVTATASPHNIISSSHADTVLTGSLSNGQMLKRVSGNWTNANLPTVEELYDTTFTGLAAGDLLQWNGSIWVNLPASSISGVHTLDSHSNVNTAGKVNGSNLRWNGSTWVVYTPTFNSGLADVNMSGLSPGQVPVWNGSVWVPGSPTATVAARYITVSSLSCAGGRVDNPSLTDYTSSSQLNVDSQGLFYALSAFGRFKLTVTGSVVLSPGSGAPSTTTVAIVAGSNRASPGVYSTIGTAQDVSGYAPTGNPIVPFAISATFALSNSNQFVAVMLGGLNCKVNIIFEYLGT